MRALRIDRFGIVRNSNGTRRDNEPRGFDEKQLDTAPAEVEAPQLSRRARQRLALAQLRSRRLSS